MKQLRLPSLVLAAGVVIGALGAHAIRPHISAESLSSFQTGVQYHFYHGLGLLLLAVLDISGKVDAGTLVWPRRLMLAGTALFPGSIYLLSTREITGWEVSWLGPVTPLGGLCFIASWLWLAVGAKKS